MKNYYYYLQGASLFLEFLFYYYLNFIIPDNFRQPSKENILLNEVDWKANYTAMLSDKYGLSLLRTTLYSTNLRYTSNSQ